MVKDKNRKVIQTPKRKYLYKRIAALKVGIAELESDYITQNLNNALIDKSFARLQASTIYQHAILAKLETNELSTVVDNASIQKKKIGYQIIKAEITRLKADMEEREAETNKRQEELKAYMEESKKWDNERIQGLLVSQVAKTIFYAIIEKIIPKKDRIQFLDHATLKYIECGSKYGSLEPEENANWIEWKENIKNIGGHWKVINRMLKQMRRRQLPIGHIDLTTVKKEELNLVVLKMYIEKNEPIFKYLSEILFSVKSKEIILKAWRRYKLFFQKSRLEKIKKIQRWWTEIYYKPGRKASLKAMKDFNNLKELQKILIA